MTIKLNHDCEAGRHTFIPTRWEEDVKIQQRWVTEFSCHHCLYYVSTARWQDHLDEITPRSVLDKSEPSSQPLDFGTTLMSGPGFRIQDHDAQIELIHELHEQAVVKLTPEKAEKKRGRPFAKGKSK
jgi:hypothetical protein